MNLDLIDSAVPGALVREGHRHTVHAIVGPKLAIPVYSGGDRFFMAGNFPFRGIAGKLGVGAPSTRDVSAWAEAANAMDAKPFIMIAEAPSVVPRRMYLALIGGASHEALHRRFTRQGKITQAELRAALEVAYRPANARFNWGGFARLVDDLQNIVEDIWIERIGRAEFPGIDQALHDLADFIIDQENTQAAEAKALEVGAAQAAFSFLREYGLGYDTPTVRARLAAYRAAQPAVAALFDRGGALDALLERTIPDTSSPGGVTRSVDALLSGVSLNLAMEWVAELSRLAGLKPAPEGQPGQGQGQPGQGQGQPGQGQGQPGQGQGQPGQGQGQPGQGQGQPGQGQPGQGQPGQGQPGQGQGQPGQGQGQPGQGQPGQGQGQPGQGQGQPGQGQGQPGQGQGQPGGGSGGGAGLEKIDPRALAEAIRAVLEDHRAKGTRLMDGNSALSSAVSGENKKEEKRLRASVTQGFRTKKTAPYRPYSTSEDKVREVKPGGSLPPDTFEACRRTTAALRTRLQLLFRALEQRSIEHGVRRGRDLDERMFVDTYGDLRAGKEPQRAFFEVDAHTIDTSVAAVFVLDESGSMADGHKRPLAAAATDALGAALEQIGAKVMVSGFRSGRKGFSADLQAALGGYPAGYHRHEPIRYDIFKSWEERWSAARARLPSWRADGGTPMADGVEFALQQLSGRREAHRLVFVFTDGEPNPSHVPVINGQLIRAAAAGVHVIGVGMGADARSVTTLFPDHVYAEQIANLPIPLVKRVEALVRSMNPETKRGTAVRPTL